MSGYEDKLRGEAMKLPEPVMGMPIEDRIHSAEKMLARGNVHGACSQLLEIVRKLIKEGR